MRQQILQAGAVALSAMVLSGLLNGCVGLVVGGAAVGASMVHDRRSAGAIMDDNTIELKLQGMLNKKLPPGNHISVTSYNATILLTGETTSAQTRMHAEQVVRGLSEPPIRRIYNELVIAPPSPVSEQSQDALITTKVKTALFQINKLPDFDPSRVKVVTAHSVVYLMGLVQPIEAAETANVASQVAGVHRVVLLFEHI